MPDMYLTISRHSTAHLVELRLPEQLDATEFDALNDQLRVAIDDRADAKWIVDLSAVSYMGSAVLGLMVNVRQRIKSGGGELILCGLSPRLAEIFRACSLERLFTFAESRAQALKATSR